MPRQEYLSRERPSLTLNIIVIVSLIHFTSGIADILEHLHLKMGATARRVWLRCILFLHRRSVPTRGVAPRLLMRSYGRHFLGAVADYTVSSA